MQYHPHEYQKYAIDFIESHPVAAVILDMGLGKTSVTLTAIANLMFDRFEISCKNSLHNLTFAIRT